VEIELADRSVLDDTRTDGRRQRDQEVVNSLILLVTWGISRDDLRLVLLYTLSSIYVGKGQIVLIP
jgi:hypothetical protein